MHPRALVLTAALVAFAATPPLAAPVDAAAQVTASIDSVVDFNGDGNADLAVGAPGEDVGQVADAGAVYVTTPGSGSQVLTQNAAVVGGTAERGDHFGASFAAGDFNGDGFTDLAVGAPSEDVKSVVGAGAVNVVYGSASGLAAAGHQVFSQNTPGVPSKAERTDLFGSSLTAGDFNNDGRTDLAVGVPLEDGIAVDEGAVNVLYGTATGLTGAGSRLFTQNNAGPASSAEAGDLFGSALATGDFDNDGFTDLAVGVPHEDVGATRNAGAVNVLRGSAGGLTGAGGQLFTENSSGLAGTAEAGDAFGAALATGLLDDDGFADLAIGVPTEDVGAVLNAGAAYTLHGSSGGLSGAGSQLLTENAPFHPDKAEAGDLFGYSLAAVDFYGVGDELFVGAPGEDVGSARDAGAVYLGAAPFNENSSNMAGTSEPGDRLGTSLAGIDTAPAEVAVGVPGESGGAGAVLIITGNLDDGDQLPPSGALINQNGGFGVPGASEPYDFFGQALAGS